ncbi:MAG: autotransporter [Solirubrobacteraceae bacterium]
MPISRAMVKSSWSRRSAGALLSVLMACAWTLVLPMPSADASPPARTARLVRITDTAHLRYNEDRSSGSWLYEEGTASGTLPGSMRANCNITATFRAVFTIYVRGGTINGRALAAVHGQGLYQSFGGSLTATGGTGRYAHAHGHGGFYGVLNRNTYDMTIQTTGSLSY